MRIARFISAVSISPFVLGLALCGAVGCDDDETVLDVETPGGQVEVERDPDTGETDVEVTDDNP
jgi:hypothetical protein